jgi:protein-disulfide isomerase
LRPGLRRDLDFLRSKRAVCVPALCGFAFVCAATWLTYPPYWEFRAPRSATPVPSGVTAEGHAWIGAEQPVLEITEFTDYQCFQCRKMHLYLRELVARYPARIRLVHRNYPMDHEFNPIVKEPFHSGSGRMALLAIHGAASGAFWELNDRLFERAGSGGRIRLEELSMETGIDQRLLSAALAHEPYRAHLLRDIREGMKLGIVGTPSYLIGGKVYEGGIPPEVLQPVIGEGEN